MRSVGLAVSLMMSIAIAGPALARTPMLRITPILAPLPSVSGGRVTVTDMAFRLPHEPLPIAAGPLPLVPGDPHLIGRFSSAMIDFFPIAGSGFHLSAGPRLFGRQATPRMPWELPRTGVGSRTTRGLDSLRGSYRRFNPAMMGGYTVAVGQAFSIGLEGGAMMGRLFSGGSATGPGGADRHAAAFRPNPVAHLDLGLRF